MSTNTRSREQLQLLRDEALEAYLNREDFQYDLNADALYRQYKDRYVELGKNAMADTMGQAAALTGGYGSSYAQNVGQQAYQSYLGQLGDVIPELYQLAYDRYQDRGDSLYRTYQSWAQLEQEAADREHQDREYELALKEYELAQKQQDENDGDNDQSNQFDGDYFAWLSTYQGAGKRPDPENPIREIEFDNQNVTTGNILTIQRVLGLEETGMWTLDQRMKYGDLGADAAWKLYQEGKLQNYATPGTGDKGLLNSNVKLMERVLGLREDGYWSEEDQKAAGGMSEAEAWAEYQKGLLQNWR